MPTRSPPIKSKGKGEEVVIYVSRTPTNMKDKRKEMDIPSSITFVSRVFNTR